MPFDNLLIIGLSIVQHNEKVAKRVNLRTPLVWKTEDWVWVHFRKERFLTQMKFKLHPKGDEPFQILEKIYDNAY